MNEAETFLRRRVLVTGATGMIGAQLTKALVQHGAEVIVLIRDYVPHNDLLRHDHPQGSASGNARAPFTVVAGQLEDYRLLERTIAEYEVEVVFHLGAQTLVQIAGRAPPWVSSS